MSASPAGRDVKACCAAAYDSDAVALLLGASYHPGGLALTRRLATMAGLRPGQRVLDVASGPGTTALLLATEFAVSVDGVDLERALELTGQAARAVAAGVAGYTMLVAEKPSCVPPQG
jgi:arsenite methyltransferase